MRSTCSWQLKPRRRPSPSIASLAPLLQTETASVGRPVSENQIQHMPSFGRDVFQAHATRAGRSFGDGSQGGAGGEDQQLPGTQGLPGGNGRKNKEHLQDRKNGPQAVKPTVARTRPMHLGRRYQHRQRGLGWYFRDYPHRESVGVSRSSPTAMTPRMAASAAHRSRSPRSPEPTPARQSLSSTPHRPGLNAY